MILEEAIPLPENHPLKGLSIEERQLATVRALGRVLADIAKRKTVGGADSNKIGTLEIKSTKRNSNLERRFASGDQEATHRSSEAESVKDWRLLASLNGGASK